MIKSGEKATRTLFEKGNDALRKNDYSEAISWYSQIITKSAELPKYLPVNLTIARQKYLLSRRSIEKLNVGLCGWDLAHNAAGRVYALATIYQTFANVGIIGSIFPCHGRDIWEPIRDTPISQNTFIVEDESKFIEQAIQFVAKHPYDIVHLSKPRFPNIIFGILYKLVWNAKVLMDIDDEELSFVGETGIITVKDYITKYGKLPELKGLHGNIWTRLAVGIATRFDGVTVANHALQQRYGGQIIGHARDEKHFQTAAIQRQANRIRFGIALDVKVVLFLGTPRVYKGLLETAKAIASLQRRDIVYAIVGDFPDANLKKQLQAIEGVHYAFIGNQPISAIPEITAMADVCVLLQKTQSITTRYQTPAKLSDALAAGLPVLATKTIALADAFVDGAVMSVNQDTLPQQLACVLDDAETYQGLRQAGIRFFRRELSIAANASRMRRVVEQSEANPLATEMNTLANSLIDGSLSTLVDFTQRVEREFAQHYPKSESKSNQKIAVAVHVYYTDLWPGISRRLKCLSGKFDLFVSTTPVHAKSVTDAVRSDFPAARINIHPNIGMDIVPFLHLIPTLVDKGYVAVCKLHTKKGSDKLAALWRRVMLDTLIGDNATFAQVEAAFVRDSSLQMVGPASLYLSAQKLMLKNLPHVKTLYKKLEGHSLPDVDWGTFYGTMFWVRPTLLKKLSDHVLNNLDQIDFSYEKDGQLVHSIERYFGLLPMLQRGKIGLLYPQQSFSGNSLQTCTAYSPPTQAWIGDIMRQYSQLDDDKTTLQDSGLFDSDYYCKQSPNLEDRTIDLIKHYLLIGRFQGNNPNPDFDPVFYRSKYAEQLNVGVDPFLHYLRHGAKADLLLRPTKELEHHEIPSFRFRALNTLLIDWNALAKAKRNPDQVSIIIPVYNNPELTRVCIESLYKHTSADLFELIVVDNGSDFTTRNMLDQFVDQYSNLIIRHNKENLNFALGCNIGFASSHGERVLFLNNDTTVTANWLEPMLEPLDRPEISVVQSLLLFPNEYIQCAGVVFSHKTPLGYPIYADYRPEKRILRPDRKFKAVSAACMMVRAKDFCTYHGFDPVFINGQEDIDLCLRLNSDGRHAHVAISSKVIHHESQSQLRYKYVPYNRKTFFNRWVGRVPRDDGNFYKEDNFVISRYEPDTHRPNEQSPIYRPVLVEKG